MRENLHDRVEKEETVVTEKELVADLTALIPREIQWEIENDYTSGAQLLADHFGKPVVVHMKGKRDSRLRKMNEGYHIPAGAGAFERKAYSRGAPTQEVFNSIESKEEQGETKIQLGIMPNSNHYIHSAEQHTQVVNDYCKSCQLSGGVSNTYGTGKKSSRKTKGRSGRKYLYLYYASKGELS